MFQDIKKLNLYKYINGTIWEDEIENRSFVIDDFSPTQILDVNYFNDQIPEDYTSQDVTVTFQVEMNVIETAEHVFVAGTFNNWDPSDHNYELILNENGIWEIDLDITASDTIFYKVIESDDWGLQGAINIDSINIYGNYNKNLRAIQEKIMNAREKRASA